MIGFRLTPRAARDLDAIALWTLRQWGAARMEGYPRSLNDLFRWLALNPNAGRARAEVHAG